MRIDATTVVTAALGFERLACIVDVRLALARGGLLAVTGLASVSGLDTWLPSELRHLLREPRPLLDHAELLLPLTGSGTAEEQTALRRELEGWDGWMRSSASGPPGIHYLGDRSDESSVPPSADSALRQRFELLRRALESLDRTPDGALTPQILLTSCFRDAIALSAALLPQRSFVLTRAGSGEEGRPELCEHLESCGLRVTYIARQGGRTTLPLRATLAQGALGPLAWAGMRLAVLHVVMPGFPATLRSDGAHDAEIARAWLDTDFFWHEVTP
jgi:hypothetical protein